MSAETWMPIAGWDGMYEVSDLGRVRSLARVITRRNGAKQTIHGRVLRPTLMSNGWYLKVDLVRLGHKRSLPVHRLVGNAFLGPLPTGMQTRHLNGNALDNRLANLKYGTPKENTADSIAHGTHLSLVHKAKTHCPRGHEYAPDNTYFKPRNDGSGQVFRICRRCEIDRNARWYRQDRLRREAEGEVTPDVIRRWASEEGITVAPTGRIPNDVKLAFAAANPDYGWTPDPVIYRGVVAKKYRAERGAA